MLYSRSRGFRAEHHHGGSWCPDSPTYDACCYTRNHSDYCPTSRYRCLWPHGILLECLARTKRTLGESWSWRFHTIHPNPCAGSTDRRELVSGIARSSHFNWMLLHQKIGNKHATPMTNPEDFGTYTDESSIDRAEEYLTRILKKGTKFKKMDQLLNELYHHSKSVSLQQLPPTSSATRLQYISSEQFTPQTRWYPSCPLHMIAWIQHSMGLRRLTTSFHQRWTPTKYLRS